MSNYEELIHGFDNLAASLGPTPIFNERGEIVPIGQPEGGRVAIYVVWVGRAVGLFHNWGLASAMVTGFSGSSHKVFRSLASARRGWLQGPTAGAGNWHPPDPRPAIPTPGHLHAATPSSGPNTSPSDDAVEWELHLDREVAVPDVGDGSGGSDIEDRDEDDHLYWRHYDDYDRPIPDRPRDDALSSTISSVSSLSLSPSPSLTAGTISPGPVDTPKLPVVSLSPPPTPRIRTSRTPSSSVGVAAPPPSSPARLQPLHRSTSAPRARSPHRLKGASQLAAPSSSKAPQRHTNATAGRSKGKFPAAEVVAVPRPREFFVVIRGEHPGIYMDKHTALLMLGTRPGMKLVIFKSLSRAAWYFVQQYMARKVGVPVMTSEPSLEA